MATPSLVSSLVAKNSASSYNDLDEMTLPAQAPAFLKPNQRAVADFIIQRLKQDRSYTFSSGTIAKTVGLSGSTVKRTLTKLQRLGLLRLHKLRSGFVRYSYHADVELAGEQSYLIPYDACKSLLDTFSETKVLAQPAELLTERDPFTKAEALSVGDLRGIQREHTVFLWGEYVRLGMVTSEGWCAFLEERVPCEVPF